MHSRVYLLAHDQTSSIQELPIGRTGGPPVSRTETNLPVELSSLSLRLLRPCEMFDLWNRKSSQEVLFCLLGFGKFFTSRSNLG